MKRELDITAEEARRLNELNFHLEKTKMELRGKERKFKTEKEFIDIFLSYIENAKVNKELPNIAGFVVFADIGRQTFYDQKEFYPYTFEKINNILENVTINCKDVSDTFKIFYMKNKFGYKDKQENINVETDFESYLKTVADEDEY